MSEDLLAGKSLVRRRVGGFHIIDSVRCANTYTIIEGVECPVFGLGS